MGFNDEPMIKQKEYSIEEYRTKKEKSIGVAKRILVMSELSSICLANLLVSLGLFVLLMIATSALPYFCDVKIEYTQENFSVRGGCFLPIMSVFLILFTIFIFWYALSYKRLEIMCIRLDGELRGALEVNEAAQRDNMINSVEKLAGAAPANYQSIDGPAGVAVNYLKENGISAINSSIFTTIKVLVILCQIILALICVMILLFG